MITTTMTLNTYRSISLLLLSYNRPGSLCRRLAASVVFDLIESRRGTVIADAYRPGFDCALSYKTSQLCCYANKLQIVVAACGGANSVTDW